MQRFDPWLTAGWAVLQCCLNLMWLYYPWHAVWRIFTQCSAVLLLPQSTHRLDYHLHMFFHWSLSLVAQVALIIDIFGSDLAESDGNGGPTSAPHMGVAWCAWRSVIIHCPLCSKGPRSTHAKSHRPGNKYTQVGESERPKLRTTNKTSADARIQSNFRKKHRQICSQYF